jgi:hypothetical protein
VELAGIVMALKTDQAELAEQQAELLQMQQY